jgi:hypothetical protein
MKNLAMHWKILIGMVLDFSLMKNLEQNGFVVD